MKKLVDRIKWEHCRKCKYNNWDDCVSYAYEAALNDVIGCEWLEVEGDENGALDGTVPLH